jgi:hypothetical protein|tara:strand:+ start:748 stop:1029 length:282 start_codon:yes stop_codon:yes gene_type:complete
MAKPINLKILSEDERTILKDAIPLLRDSDPYYWENKSFKDSYAKWIDTTNGQFADGGFEQFKLAVAQMRNKMPLTYKDNGTLLRKVIRGDIQC